MILNLPDYPTADLGRPGRYPHRTIAGRLLVVRHERDADAEPPTLEQMASAEGWAHLEGDEAETYAAEARARLEAWARDEWDYLVILVSIRQAWGGQCPREIGGATLGGVESDAGEPYLADVGGDLYLEALADVAALEVAMTHAEDRPWPAAPTGKQTT